MAFFLRGRPLSQRLVRIQAIPIFSTLDVRGLRIVEGLMHERSYAPGEVIFDAGEEGQAIYVVFDGRILICHQGQGEAGGITEVGAGAFLGELALLEGTPRAAQAVAADACTLGVLFREDFHTLLETDARIAARISFQLARHLGGILVEAALSHPAKPV